MSYIKVLLVVFIRKTGIGIKRRTLAKVLKLLVFLSQVYPVSLRHRAHIEMVQVNSLTVNLLSIEVLE